MSSLKKDFPVTAYLIRTPYLLANGYSDAIAVVAVQVLSVIDGQACCGVRNGGISKIEVHAVTELASTPEKALAKIAPHLVAMQSRPLLKTEAGKTDSVATEVSINPATGRRIAAPVIAQDAPADVESHPEPLAGPRPARSHLPYADN